MTLTLISLLILSLILLSFACIMVLHISMFESSIILHITASTAILLRTGIGLRDAIYSLFFISPTGYSLSLLQAIFHLEKVHDSHEVLKTENHAGVSSVIILITYGDRCFVHNYFYVILLK